MGFCCLRASQGALVVRNLPANVGDAGDAAQPLWAFGREGLTTELYQLSKYWPTAHWVFWGEHPQLRVHPFQDTFVLVRRGMATRWDQRAPLPSTLRAPGGASAKEPTCQCRRHRDSGWIPGSGRSPGGGHGNPLQYSCLENSMDRGAWWATAYRVTKSQTRLNRLSMPARKGEY